MMTEKLMKELRLYGRMTCTENHLGCSGCVFFSDRLSKNYLHALLQSYGQTASALATCEKEIIGRYLRMRKEVNASCDAAN